MEWKIQKQDKKQAADLAKQLGVSTLTARLLMNRGVRDPAEAREFLNPSLDQLTPDRWMADMEPAADRVAEALKSKETVGVHGDYDVDGICAAALLIDLFTKLGGKVVWHLPHRRKEGYGMKPAGVEDLIKKGASLVLAVDCGVSDHDALVFAKDRSVDAIIIDHHQIPDEPPPALALINHNRPDCPFAGSELSAAGAAFYFAAALRSKLRESGELGEDRGPNLLSYLDLVAMATVADVVPMTGLNRVMTHFGLEQIKAGRRPGVLQLRRAAGILDREVSTGAIAFQLAPRINAAGRLGSGDPALRLLLSRDEAEAGRIADELERMNRTRQTVEESILEEALAQIESQPGAAEAPAIVVWGRDWHVGVIGIVASRITDKFTRPAAVIGVSGDTGKGSLRSIAGVNIYSALKECAPLLSAYGGHPMAAGITINPDKIESFREKLCEAVKRTAPPEAFTPGLRVEAEWPLYRVDLALAHELALLKPHGMGNPEPALLAKRVEVKWSREARKNTLLMGLKERDAVMDAVGFDMGRLLPAPGERLDVVYVPVADEYGGKRRVKIKIKSLRKAE